MSFHVGSACKNLATFSGAIETAREIFDVAEAMGHAMELLDIGGGFTGHFDCAGNVRRAAPPARAAVPACLPACLPAWPRCVCPGSLTRPAPAPARAPCR